MKRIIAIIALLVLGTLGMACGGDVPNRKGDSQETYHVTCYSGGQKVLEMEKARKAEVHYDAEIVKIYTEGTRTVHTPSTECFEENN